ncbi:MAG: hypothetical protein M3300_09510, partial [Actinomycetota bacterium]|nr:hypothetical protein [Actinomycetota bacterium]
MPARELLHDPGRLAAVAAVLQVAKASQEVLDRLAELAAIVMDAPIALVNVIDTQLHLVGQFGLTEPFATSRQSSISNDFCQSTGFAAHPIFIEDATEE